MEKDDLLDNRYQILGKLGEGGMGAVYKAWDQELEKEVAIKALLPQLLEDPAAEEDMKKEVKLSQGLGHPHIVKIFDYKVHQRTPYILMEFIPGITLSLYLFQKTNRRLKEDEFYQISEQILSGVEYAHKEGVIHRDLKSGNIMITPDNKVKIMDFGIAATIKQTYTRVNGKPSSVTPQYASPEQINGETPDVRSDIYSLGCVFYEMLTEHPPFYQGEIIHQ